MAFDRERASFLQVLDEGLGATVNVQFFVNVLEMVMDRPDANGEGAGDLLVQKAFADVTEYFLLPGGETGQAGGFVAALSGCKEILEVIPDSRQNLLRGKNPLAQRALNWLKQLGWFPAPKDITGGDAAEGELVGEVHIGVEQRVEDQVAAARAFGVRDDPSAVVGRLDPAG